MKRLSIRLAACLALCFPSLVSAEKFKESKVIESPKDGIAVLAISPDGKILALADEKKTVVLRNTGSGKELASLRGLTAPVVSLAFSADGKKLITLSTDKSVKVWDAASGKQKAGFQNVKVKAGLPAFGTDGKVLLAHVVHGSDDKIDWVEVRLLDVASGKNRVIAKRSTPVGVPGISANFTLLAIAPDGKRLAVGSTDVGGGFRASLFDTASGKPIKFAGELPRDSRLAFGRDGKSLISASGGSVKHWNLANGKVLSSTKAAADVAAISGDGRTLITVGPKNAIKIWAAALDDPKK